MSRGRFRVEGGRSLNTTVERQDGYALVAVEGRVIRENQGDLRTELEGLISEGVKGIVLDLEGVEYMDSGGLGCCAAVQKTFKAKGTGSLVVVGASPNIQRMWKLIRLDLVIAIFPEKEAALNHLAKETPSGGD